MDPFFHRITNQVITRLFFGSSISLLLRHVFEGLSQGISLGFG